MAYTQLGYGDPATWGGRFPCPENKPDEDVIEEKKVYPLEVKSLILRKFEIGKTAAEIIETMRKYGLLAMMTDSSAARFKRAIESYEFVRKVELRKVA